MAGLHDPQLLPAAAGPPPPFICQVGPTNWTSLLAPPSGAAQLYGPYRAEIVRVVDGDTPDLWPSLRARSMVRIKGLDTPELRGRACERRLAQRARDYLATLAMGRRRSSRSRG